MSLYDIDLNNATNEEMITLTSQISKKSVSELTKLFTEAERAGKADLLKQTWKQDVEDRIKFFEDQKKNGLFNIVKKPHPLFCFCVIVTSYKGNRWSLITIRMGK